MELSYLATHLKARFTKEVIGKKEIPSHQLAYSLSVLALKSPFYLFLLWRYLLGIEFISAKWSINVADFWQSDCEGGRKVS